MKGLKSLGSYCLERYKGRTGSIFLDGLVGGMFLNFLLDTKEHCAERDFTELFFWIGLAHYISTTVKDMSEYAKAAAEKDKVITKMEMILDNGGFYMLHFIRIAQYPMVPALMYYLIKITLVERDQWTHDKEAEPEKKYCEANDVHLAEMTVAFQTVYGLMILLTWIIMWKVDGEDDEQEEMQQRQWQEDESKQEGTIWGNIKEMVFVVSMHSFFDAQVASTFLALAIALPQDSCNIDVTRWFLMAGVVQTCTAVLNDLRGQVEMLAALDGIINKVEHRLIQFLRFVNFPFFCIEVVSFVMISLHVVEHWDSIDYKSRELEVEGENRELEDEVEMRLNPSYCESGTWHLMVAVMFIYAIVLMFRVAVTVASLMGGRENKKK